ncbi:MAG: Ni-sirohydrochlorin a,c-diamide synthase [Methanophagales archaeon]|nr:Ni-sirohydrochlorin a,c-diamide synthase [Methanophagales archaeon]MCW3142021.1 Ni-sirohydrochlorin a,c-diamide synthase [Methanophagales archaeon]
MNISIPRVVIAGDRSSAGKTTVCIGLLSALRAQGFEVQGFKVGLDYIDPGFHTLVSGRPSRNLDGFLMSPEVVKEIFFRGCAGADIAVIEGVRGLYEGLNYSDDTGSTAQIAKILRCPVILVVDAGSITRSAAAVVNGYKSFDSKVQISGVILNNIGSKRHGEKAELAVEEYSGVKVIGKIPRKSDLGISMRHLGLITATECENRRDDFDSVLNKIKTAVEKNVDMKMFFDIAKSACALKTPETRIFHAKRGGSEESKVRIAVAFDEAFNFYYQDTLDLLALEGAELVYFSPIRDKKLPEGADAVYIGGGFPEIYAEELSSNSQMRNAVKDFYDRYGVIYAECGGLMYLLEQLEYTPLHGLPGRRAESHGEGGSFEMCGVIKGLVRFGEKRVVNYVEGEFQKDCILGKKRGRFKGHEFHHSEILLENRSNVDFAYKMLRGEGITDGMDGIITKNCLASFAHLHAASYTEFAENFVGSACQTKNKNL